MKDIKIIVATHKKYDFPEDIEMYIPVQSGAALVNPLGYQCDNEGDNISYKNLQYNELCPMYWAWKNIKSDYVGLVHYRRYFSKDKFLHEDIKDVLNRNKCEELLENYDIILPRKNKYFVSIETHYLYSYAGNKVLLKDDLKCLRNAINNISPEYSGALESVLMSKEAHMYHMCVMKKELYDEYCEFMFGVSFEIEKIRGIRVPSDRYIGGLTEFLLDVWLKKKNYRYCELGLVELEHESMIKKVMRVLKRMLIKDERIWEEKKIGK